MLYLIMKKTLLILTIIVTSIITASAQKKVTTNKPYSTLNNSPGYITYNELTQGIGLSVTSVPYSNSLTGFTTIHGYMLNKNISVAAGTGISFYNGGNMIPVFADIRYRSNFKFRVKKLFGIQSNNINPKSVSLTPYMFFDSGILFPVSEPDPGKKLFMKAGLGLIYPIDSKTGINFGTGLFSQFGDRRDSFLVFKLGLLLKPGK
jgi:hypothetical protein